MPIEEDNIAVLDDREDTQHSHAYPALFRYPATHRLPASLDMPKSQKY